MSDTTTKVLDIMKPIMDGVALASPIIPGIGPFSPLVVGLAAIGDHFIVERSIALDEAENKAHAAVKEWIAALGSLRAEVEADDEAAIAEAVANDPSGVHEG